MPEELELGQGRERALRLVGRARERGQRVTSTADGAAYHRNTTREDAERQATLEATGERVIRISYTQVTRHPEQTAERLKRAGAPTA